MKKSNQFHELLDHEESIPLPSERSFAHVMGALFFILAGIRWWHREHIDAVILVLLAVGAAFLFIGYTKPLLLRPLNKLWMQFGHLLFKITNPIIMFLIYAVTIVPMGLALRVLGKDPLRRAFDAKAATYWIMRDIPGPPPETMKRQF